ncbi:hypothetical protein V8F20_006114 [Naviculisporaceae sp. PSN 640]
MIRQSLTFWRAVLSYFSHSQALASPYCWPISIQICSSLGHRLTLGCWNFARSRLTYFLLVAYNSKPESRVFCGPGTGRAGGWFQPFFLPSPTLHDFLRPTLDHCISCSQHR